MYLTRTTCETKEEKQGLFWLKCS